MKLHIILSVRYKRIGNKDYAYEVSSYYDRMNKGPAQKSRHLDQVDHVTKNIIHPSSEPSKEKLILDFGYYTNMKLIFLPPILLI